MIIICNTLDCCMMIIRVCLKVVCVKFWLKEDTVLHSTGLFCMQHLQFSAGNILTRYDIHVCMCVY